MENGNMSIDELIAAYGQLPAIHLTTVEDFENLPVEDRNHITKMHMIEWMLDRISESTVVESYRNMVTKFMTDQLTFDVTRNGSFSTSNVVNSHLNGIVEDKVFGMIMQHCFNDE